jgi:hypothetical protein
MLRLARNSLPQQCQFEFCNSHNYIIQRKGPMWAASTLPFIAAGMGRINWA